ncbi:MAG: hypothetical protein WC612_05585 [Bdellovibrionales bacterium]
MFICSSYIGRDYDSQGAEELIASAQNAIAQGDVSEMVKVGQNLVVAVSEKQMGARLCLKDVTDELYKKGGSDAVRPIIIKAAEYAVTVLAPYPTH